MNIWLKTYLSLVFIIFSQVCMAQPAKIDIELTVPAFDESPYHRPFVAVWLETSERKPIATIAIWYDDAEWLKDLRQWWRRLGRQQKSENLLDGLSGATQKPGSHHLSWQGDIEQTEIYLNFEAVREEGGRSYFRQLLDLNHTNKYSIEAMPELGPITIQISKP